MARVLMCWELGYAERLAHFNMKAAMQGALESIESLAKMRA